MFAVRVYEESSLRLYSKAIGFVPMGQKIPVRPSFLSPDKYERV